MNTVTAPPMTREQYDQLPDIVKRFVSWEHASQEQTFQTPTEESKAAAIAYFTEER